MADHVVHVADDNQYTQEIERAGDLLVVVDFFATWCGPCRRIAPHFGELASKYQTSARFLKVDVDQCRVTSSALGVMSLPTFMFFKNNEKVGEIKGADPAALESTVKRLIGQSSTAKPSTVQGHPSLQEYINNNQVEVLNESDYHTKSALFADDKSYLESDCDEQLLITLPFTQPVKVHSLKIAGPSDGSAPKEIRLFINQPTAPGFEEAETMKSTQDFVLSPSDVSGEHCVNLLFVRFQNVQSITIFVKSNQGGASTTKIRYLELLGLPASGTDMASFKRVAGTVGEAHG